MAEGRQRPAPTDLAAVDQAHLGPAVLPAVDGFLAEGEGVGGGFAGLLLLPLEQRRFQGLAQRLPRQQEQDPVVGGAAGAGIVGALGGSRLHPRAMFAGDPLGGIAGAVVDHQQLVAAAQGIERAPDAPGVVCGVQEGGEAGHGQRE